MYVILQLKNGHTIDSLFRGFEKMEYSYVGRKMRAVNFGGTGVDAHTFEKENGKGIYYWLLFSKAEIGLYPFKGGEILAVANYDFYEDRGKKYIKKAQRLAVDEIQALNTYLKDTGAASIVPREYRAYHMTLRMSPLTSKTRLSRVLRKMGYEFKIARGKFLKADEKYHATVTVIYVGMDIHVRFTYGEKRAGARRHFLIKEKAKEEGDLFLEYLKHYNEYMRETGQRRFSSVRT